MNPALRPRLDRHARIALGCGLAVGGAAQASLVWSGEVNLIIPSNVNGLYLNVLTGQWNQTGGTGATVPGWDINPWGSTNLAMFSPQVPAGGAYSMMPGQTSPSNMPLASPVTSQTLFGSGVVSTTSAYPFLLNSTNNHVGFRFFNEATQDVHYGWFRMALSESLGSQPRVLIEYLYESNPGVPITIGFVPSPGAPLLAGLAALAWGRRSRRELQRDP